MFHSLQSSNKSSSSSPDDVGNHVKVANQSLFPSPSVGLAPTTAPRVSFNTSSGIEEGNFLEIITALSADSHQQPTGFSLFSFLAVPPQDLYAWDTSRQSERHSLLPTTLMLLVAVTRIPFASILVIWTSTPRLRLRKTGRTRSARRPSALWIVPWTYMLSRYPLLTGFKVSRHDGGF